MTSVAGAGVKRRRWNRSEYVGTDQNALNELQYFGTDIRICWNWPYVYVSLILYYWRWTNPTITIMFCRYSLDVEHHARTERSVMSQLKVHHSVTTLLQLTQYGVPSPETTATQTTTMMDDLGTNIKEDTTITNRMAWRMRDQCLRLVWIVLYRISRRRSWIQKTSGKIYLTLSVVLQQHPLHNTMIAGMDCRGRGKDQSGGHWRVCLLYRVLKSMCSKHTILSIDVLFLT